MKRPISLLLAGTLLAALAGCGGTPASDEILINASAAMGRWVEQSVALPVGTPVCGPFLQEDGSLLLFTEKESATIEDSLLYALRSDDDGVTWTEEPGLLPDGLDGTPLLAAAAPDGTLLVETFRVEEDDAVFTADWLCLPGQEPRRLDLGGLTDETPAPNFSVFLDNDTLLLGVTGSSGLYTSTDDRGDPPLLHRIGAGTTVWLENAPVGVYDMMYAGAAAGRLYYMDADNNSLCAMDRTGAAVTLLETMPAGHYNTVLDADEDGALYFANLDGIYRLAPGGTLPELLVDGVGTALGVDSNYLTGLCRTGAGNFIVTLGLSSGGGAQLCRYYFDETLPAVAESSLEVWALTDGQPTVRAAINAYKQAHPEVDVKLTVGVPNPDEGDFSAARRDALTTLNTQLLAGGGPDLLILDGTDWQTYLDKGVLADLSGTVDTGALQSNLIAPFVEADGSARLLPARFTLPVIVGDAGTLGGLTDLEAMQAEVERCAPRPDTDAYSDFYYEALPEGEKYALGIMNTGDLTEFVMQSSAAAILQDGAVDEAALRRALAFAQAVIDRYGMADYRPAAETQESITALSGGEGDIVVLDQSLDEYSTCQRAKYGWGTMTTPWLLAFAAHKTGEPLDFDTPYEDSPFEMALRPGLCEGAYTPAVLVAVNAAGAQPEYARELAAVFFGAGVQDIYCQDGMPVRAESLRAALAAAQAARRAAASQTDLTALVESCRTPVLPPQELWDSFEEHLTAMASGAEDLDAAVAGVQRDLGLYLAERG